MASNKMSALTSMLEDVINDNSFTVQAMERMKAALTKAASLEADLAEVKRELEYVVGQKVEQAGIIAKLNGKLLKYQARENELVARENKMAVLEKDTAVAQAESRVYDKVFNTVFKNTTVRENMYGNTSAYSNGCYQSVPTSHSIERTTD